MFRNEPPGGSAPVAARPREHPPGVGWRPARVAGGRAGENPGGAEKGARGGRGEWAPSAGSSAGHCQTGQMPLDTPAARPPAARRRAGGGSGGEQGQQRTVQRLRRAAEAGAEPSGGKWQSGGEIRRRASEPSISFSSMAATCAASPRNDRHWHTVTWSVSAPSRCSRVTRTRSTCGARSTAPRRGVCLGLWQAGQQAGGRASGAARLVSVVAA